MTYERVIAQLTASLIMVGTPVKAVLHHVLVLVECHGRGEIDRKRSEREIVDHPEALIT